MQLAALPVCRVVALLHRVDSPFEPRPQSIAELGRVGYDGSAGGLKRSNLGCRIWLTGNGKCPGMAHYAAGGFGNAGDQSDDRPARKDLDAQPKGRSQIHTYFGVVVRERYSRILPNVG